MDLEQAFDRVVSIVSENADLDRAWNDLRHYLDAGAQGIGRALEPLDVREDVARVRSQLDTVLLNEPPPSDIDAIYFGLFDAIDGNDELTIGYYVSGVSGYDESDGDALVDPGWWPEARYLDSEVLSTLRSSQNDCKGDEESFLGYAGQLGVALLLTKFASHELFGDRRILVGFDSGDVAHLR